MVKLTDHYSRAMRQLQSRRTGREMEIEKERVRRRGVLEGKAEEADPICDGFPKS